MSKPKLRTNDDFSPELQVSARLLGKYDEIAQRAESSGQCVFCDLREKYIIAEYHGVVLTANLFPRSTGDLLIIPRRHIETYEELTNDEHLAIAHLNKLGMKLLDEALGINSFYLLLRDGKGTDKTVRHLHGQVMNFWKGLIDWHPETNPLSPVEVAEKLREAVKGVENANS